MPDIVLRNVTKSYERGGIHAVSDLNLEIASGEFMCLLGPSGCGKTTTLRMIAGLENLTDGEISVGERLVDSVGAGVFVPPERRDMGLVFQSYALWPHLTIERNTDFGLRLRRVPKQEREERVDHVMKTLGIDQFRDRYPSQLSGGQQQRVALARMLAVNPEVLLLDEPLSNLDARLRLEMRAELKRIHSEFGTTIVFVTHDQWEAMTLATSIAVLNDGALQQVGTPNDIYDRPANRFVAEFVGSPPINVIDLNVQNAGPASPLADQLGKLVSSQEVSVSSVGIRPEHIRIDDHDSDGRFPAAATVAAVLPTGGSWIVELRVDGMPLFMSTSQLPGFSAGDNVMLSVEPSLLHFFGPDDRRLPAATRPDEVPDLPRSAALAGQFSQPTKEERQ